MSSADRAGRAGAQLASQGSCVELRKRPSCAANRLLAWPSSHWRQRRPVQVGLCVRRALARQLRGTQMEEASLWKVDTLAACNFKVGADPSRPEIIMAAQRPRR